MRLDELFPLRELASRLPKRNGKRVHYSTLIRWATRGVRGRTLRTVPIGGMLFTSMEAVGEFMMPRASEEPSDESHARKAEVEMAEAELDSLGIR